MACSTFLAFLQLTKESTIVPRNIEVPNAVSMVEASGNRFNCDNLIMLLVLLNGTQNRIHLEHCIILLVGLEIALYFK